MAKQNGFRKFQLSDSYLNLIVGTIVVIIIAIVVVGLVRSKTTQIPPQTEDQQTEQNETTSQQTNLPTKHKVVAGESLWKIAEKYYKTGFNWVDIAKENRLSNPNALTEGMELTIPNVTPIPAQASVSPIPSMSSPSSVSESSMEKTVKPQSGAITGNTYTVVSGDNLWNIALRAYGDGYKWINIARANKLVNPNIIHPGNNFTIPR